jgi:hypothetical protein
MTQSLANLAIIALMVAILRFWLSLGLGSGLQPLGLICPKPQAQAESRKPKAESPEAGTGSRNDEPRCATDELERHHLTPHANRARTDTPSEAACEQFWATAHVSRSGHPACEESARHLQRFSSERPHPLPPSTLTVM